MKRHLRGAAIAVLTAIGLAMSLNQPGLQAQATRGSDSAEIVPYKIVIDDGVINDLKVRLARTRFPDEIPGTGWEYGTNLAYLRDLVGYWRSGFDWREAERKLNQLEQFTTLIDGVQIHFIHQKSKDPKAMPLAITHGWPGSIFEFSKVIGPLTDPERSGGKPGDAFHVVAISLPGFGFSGHPTSRGYSPERMAKIIATLMARLGYTKYGVQGGDWGGIISRLVALNDAEHVAGLHLNFCIAGAPSEGDPNEGIPREQLVLMESRNKYMENERAYQQLQATKPQTLGFGLNDSPAGLAAWIVEKFRDLVRLRRQRREEVLEGRSADQHHDLLGHAVGGILHENLLREPRGDAESGKGERADGLRGFSEGDWSRRRGGGSRPVTT